MTRYRQTMAEAMEMVHLSEKEINKLRNGVKVLGNALPNRAVAQQMADKANKEMGHDADVYQSPFNNRFYVRIKEDVNEDKGFTDQQIKMAYGIANDKRYKGGNMTGAVSAIEKIAKGLSNHPDVQKVLKRTNEELDEAFSDTQIAQLKKAYEPLRDKKISIDNANKLRAMLSTIDNNKTALEKLYKADVPFVSSLASARLISKHGYKADKLISLRKEGIDIAVEELNQMNEVVNPTKPAKDEKQDKKPFDKASDPEAKVSMEPKEAAGDEKDKKDLAKKDSEVAMLKQKIETEKQKAIQKQTQVQVNPETGEPLLKIGLAYKLIKDKMKKDEVKKDEVKEESLDEFNKKDYDKNEDENEHSLNALELVKKFGTPAEKKEMQGIYDRHMKRGSITEPDYSKRNAFDKKYYPKLKESKLYNEMFGNKQISPTQAALLRKYLGMVGNAGAPFPPIREDNVDEGKMSAISAMQDAGKSSEEIAKALKLDVKTVKTILGEEVINEKLKVSDGLGTWIDDFVNSDAPQFKGKSKEDKKNMAIAAFTDAGGKLEQNEGSDRIENDPCWKGYKMVGMKKKGGKEVPNCVPEGAIKLVDDILSKKLKGRK